MYPDIGVLIPKLGKRGAIELGHSQAEKTAIPGSKFKMALAKAAFSFLSHDWIIATFCPVINPMKTYGKVLEQKDRKRNSRYVRIWVAHKNSSF